MSPNLETVPQRIINVPEGRILRSFCKRIGWCVCDTDSPEVHVVHRVYDYHRKVQTMTAPPVEYRSQVKDTTTYSTVSLSTNKHDGLSSRGTGTNFAASSSSTNQHDELSRRGSDTKIAAISSNTNQHSGLLPGIYTSDVTATYQSQQQQQLEPELELPMDDYVADLVDPQFVHIVNRIQVGLIGLWQSKIILLLILLGAVLISLNFSEFSLSFPSVRLFDTDSATPSELTVNGLKPESTTKPLNPTADTEEKQHHSSEKHIQMANNQLQKAMSNLENQVKDLTKRADKCANQWTNEAALTRSLQAKIENQLNNHPTKSDHSKLLSLLESLKASTDARFEKQSSRIDRLEQSISVLIARGGQSIKSAQAAVEADQMPDYALKSGGGAVIVAQNGNCRSSNRWQRWRHWWQQLPHPDTIISKSGVSSALQPGNCWSFGGFPGRVIIKLGRPIRVSAVSIDHISRLQAYNNSLTSAPRQFCVYGLTSICDFKTRRKFGCFAYDADLGPQTQTFHFDNSDKSLMQSIFKYVLFEVLSNHGHSGFTCVYRFRVHGKM